MTLVISLDIGSKKTGIAKSDIMGLVIKPLKTIATEKLINELQAIKQESGIDKLIIGKPVNIQGGNNDALTMVQKTAEGIQASLSDLEIVWVNESFTSKEAEHIIKEQGIKINKDNKELIDMYAAAIILEQYFDSQK